MKKPSVRGWIIIGAGGAVAGASIGIGLFVSEYQEELLHRQEVAYAKLRLGGAALAMLAAC